MESKTQIHADKTQIIADEKSADIGVSISINQRLSHVNIEISVYNLEDWIMGLGEGMLEC